MDIARAIAKIDPKGAYLLNHSQADDRQVILAWRGPGKEPTAKELDDAWLLCVADDEAEAAKEQEQEQALTRVKADPALDDLVKALDL